MHRGIQWGMFITDLKSMKRSSRYIFILALLAVGMSYYGRYQFRRDFSYVLSSNLDRAHGALQHQDGRIKTGVYAGERQSLEYPQEPRWFNVEKSASRFEGRHDALILLHPVRGGTHRISFPVPHDALNVRFMWGFSDDVLRNPHGGAVRLRVLVGDLPLLEVDCISQEGCLGLKSQDLTMPAADASSSSSVTVEVQPLSDNVDYHHFFFDGYVW